MADTLIFESIEGISIPVLMEGCEYTLKEATGLVTQQFNNAILACTKLGPNGKPSSVRGLAKVETLLISLCLVDSEGKSVSQDTINKWPSRISSKLFAEAKRISGLDDEPKERAQLKEALDSNSESMVTFSGLQDWVESLDSETYSDLKKWLERTPEELAKNLQSDTGDGSD